MEVIDFEQYAARFGGARADIGDAGTHSPMGHMSKRARDAAIKAVSARSAATVERRDELRKQYDAAIARGEIRPPTFDERIERTAAGHPDNPSVQAARRILEKRKNLAASNR